MTVNPQLELLVRLQELDREAAQLAQKLAEIAPQIEEGRVHLAAAERALEEGRAKVEGSKKLRRQAERELDEHVEKRRKFQDQQGKVKTNKEYQALMGELETLKREESALEDRILGIMEGQGEIERTLPALAAEVAREKAEFEAKERELRGVEVRLREQLEAAQGRRQETVAAIDPGNLQVYQRVQKLRGTAVAEVREELCLGCSRMIPPQRYVEAMRGDALVSCPHCHRILFHRRAEPAGAGAGA